MQAVLDFFQHQFWGAPAWVWLISLVVLPVVNELVNRTRATAAQSLLQAVARALAVPFGRVPVLGDVLRYLSGPTPAPPPKDPPTIVPLLPLLLLPLFSACAPSPADAARQTVANYSQIVGAGYRGCRAYVRQGVEAAVAKARAGDEGARADVERVDKMAKRLLQLLDLATDATDAALSGIDVAEKVGNRDYLAILEPAARALAAVIEALADAGVVLPGASAPATKTPAAAPPAVVPAT